MNLDQILGLSEDHLTPLEVNGTWYNIHTEAKHSFTTLKAQAMEEQTIDLYPVSVFRDFQKQQSIWNAKAGGHQTIRNDEGEILDHNLLTEEETLWAIMRWTALPGTSRHHWGTDLDVIDAIALHQFQENSPEYKLKLTPQEFEGEPFENLHQWLGNKIQHNQSQGFFRPYSQDLGGVSPEPWHLSYWPVSGQVDHILTLQKFQDLLESETYKNLELLEVVKHHAEKIYTTYVTNITPPPF